MSVAGASGIGAAWRGSADSGRLDELSGLADEGGSGEWVMIGFAK